jgi:COP9 signalosome complex subunit 6
VQLVLINISDHFMRIRMSGDEVTPRVVGCLLGEQTGRTVDISNSFEMVATGSDKSPDFDRLVFDAKQSQYAECFKTLHVLGWYSTGGPVQERELQLHKKFMEHTETQAPILLMLDTARAMAPAAKELPVDMFESGTDHTVTPIGVASG